MAKLDQNGMFIGEHIVENKLVEYATRINAPLKIAEVVSTLEATSLVVTPNSDRVCGVYPRTMKNYVPYPSKVERVEQGIEEVASGFIGREGDDCFYRITEERVPISWFTLEGLMARLGRRKPKCLRIEKIDRKLLGYPEGSKLTTNFFVWVGSYKELLDEVRRDISEISLSKYGKPAIIDI